MRRLPCLALPFLTLAGCGGGGPGPGGGSGATDYYPLAKGARWEYRRLGGAAGPETVVKEIVDCLNVSFVDCVTGDDRSHETYVQESTGEAQPDELGLTYLESSGDGIVRVKQDFQTAGGLDHFVTYSPYFMRLFAPPYDEGREETFEHERCEYGADGTPRGQTTRGYRHQVVGEQDVTVPAGDYRALVVERVDTADGDTKRYYWADGVGKVLEEEILSDGSIGETEELVAYTAGIDSCF